MAARVQLQDRLNVGRYSRFYSCHNAYTTGNGIWASGKSGSSCGNLYGFLSSFNIHNAWHIQARIYGLVLFYVSKTCQLQFSL